MKIHFSGKRNGCKDRMVQRVFLCDPAFWRQKSQSVQFENYRHRGLRFFSLICFVLVVLQSDGQRKQRNTVNNKSSGEVVMTQDFMPPSIIVKEKKFSPDAFQIAGDHHLNKLADRKKGLEGMAECHLTIADAAYPQNLALCEKLGLSVIVSAGSRLTGGDWMKMSDAEIDSYVKNMVQNGGKSKTIIGYFICDEPSALVFPALAKAVAAVKKYAPGKIAFINLYPNYATLWQIGKVKSQLGTASYTEYLERFVNEVKPQLICYDNYMVLYSMDLKNPALAAKYYTNLLEVRRVAHKYKLPFWNWVSSNQIRPHTTIPSPANLSLQAYTTLASGASGIRWYTYHGRAYGYNPLDKNENKTLTWYYLQEVNRQVAVLGPIIKQLTSTGVYFTQPAPDSSLPVLPGKQVERVEADAPMMVGEFVSANGSNYIMVVNLSLEKSVKFDLQTKIPDEEIWIVSTTRDGALDPASHQKGIWLTAGQGVLIKCGGKSEKKFGNNRIQ